MCRSLLAEAAAQSRDSASEKQGSEPTSPAQSSPHPQSPRRPPSVLCLWFLTQQWLTGCTIGNENIIAAHIVCFHNVIGSNDLTTCLHRICSIYVAASFLEVIKHQSTEIYPSIRAEHFLFGSCLCVWTFPGVLPFLRHVLTSHI